MLAIRTAMASAVVISTAAACVPGATGAFMSPPTVRASDIAPGAPKRERRMGDNIFLRTAPYGAELLTFGGNIHIRQAEGFVAASTFGGGIDIDSLIAGGRLVAHGGDVRLQLAPSASQRDLDITVRGGDVRLELPKNASATIQIRQTYGRDHDRMSRSRIESSIPLKKSEPSPWKREAKHGFRYRQRVDATGSVGGGRDRITIQVDDGSVILTGR